MEWQPIETAPNMRVIIGGWWGVNGVLKWNEEVLNPFINVSERKSFIHKLPQPKYKNVYIHSSYTHWREVPPPPHN